MHGEETITFDPDVPVRAVDAVTTGVDIGSLQFYDGNDELIADYDPVDVLALYREYNEEKWIWKDSRYELADNEELVGVYGIVDYYSALSQFGFVVKVKPDVPAVGCLSDAALDKMIHDTYGNNVSGF